MAASSNITAVALTNQAVDYEDLNTFASNYLYAGGSARRIAYETALEVPLSSDADLNYTVAAKATILQYRMMFVPCILLIALWALVIVDVVVF